MNPLGQYRYDNRLSWKRLAERCGLYISQVNTISRAEPEEVLAMTAKTILRVRKGTGVDLLKYAAKGDKMMVPAEPSDSSTDTALPVTEVDVAKEAAVG